MMGGDPFERTKLLLGDEAIDRLEKSRVALFGLGGVGGYALEALTRSGVGALLLVDSDVVSISNLNRQILATQHSLGKLKTEAARERVLSINPACQVDTKDIFFLPENAADFDFSHIDFIIDAMDTVTAKLALIQEARKRNIPLISCLGTGNKTDPSRLKAGDLFESSICPLARVMRRECKKRGIDRLRVVYSTEPPLKPVREVQKERPAGGRRDIPGSTAFVPGAAGLLLAAEAVRHLVNSSDS